MKKTTRILSMLVIGALVAAAPLAYAGPGPDKEGRSKEWKEKWEAKRQKLYEQLQLTDEQKKALDENKKQSRENRKSAAKAMKDNMDLIRQELQKPELDMARITQIQNELKASQIRMLDARLDGILAARKILTPEQFSKFMEKMEKSRKHYKGGYEDGAESKE